MENIFDFYGNLIKEISDIFDDIIENPKKEVSEVVHEVTKNEPKGELGKYLEEKRFIKEQLNVIEQDLKEVEETLKEKNKEIEKLHKYYQTLTCDDVPRFVFSATEGAIDNLSKEIQEYKEKQKYLGDCYDSNKLRLNEIENKIESYNNQKNEIALEEDYNNGYEVSHTYVTVNNNGNTQCTTTIKPFEKDIKKASELVNEDIIVAFKNLAKEYADEYIYPYLTNIDDKFKERFENGLVEFGSYFYSKYRK